VREPCREEEDVNGDQVERGHAQNKIVDVVAWRLGERRDAARAGAGAGRPWSGGARRDRDDERAGALVGAGMARGEEGAPAAKPRPRVS
jgi:hypothetical protein